MKLTTFVAALAGGCLATSAMAQSDALAQIAELRAQLAAVQAQAGNNTLTEERANEIKSIVRDTLADADTRTSLQGGGAMAGYDNGFFMSSADGNFKLKLGVLEQVRYVWEFNSEDQMGFENRRTQLNFGGNMFDPSWTYKVRFNYSPYSTAYGETDGEMTLADAAITKTMDGGIAITAGQYRTPFTRATLVDDGVQLSADYSPADYQMSAGYMQGIMGSWSSDMFKVMASIGDAINTTNNSWAQSPNGAAGSFNGAVRVEAKLNGSWSQFNKETSFRGEEFGLLVGAAYVHSDSETTAYTSPYNAFTVDATAFFGGANLAAAYTYANADQYSAVVSNGQDLWTLTVQGGLFVTDAIEAFGAWNYFDGDINTTSFLQFGANWYFAKNGCKWTTQIAIPLDGDSTFAPADSAAWGWSPSADLATTGGGSDPAFLTQLQFMF